MPVGFDLSHNREEIDRKTETQHLTLSLSTEVKSKWPVETWEF